ncbi:protein-L-isoaspartate O-methyltransferase family protein [Pseudoxanthomonas daejeonensis]|uniref:Protein-L-isoaspartate O-methyltransferase n=1 Tax=Pseudoxanthomonas daejeonensis TaxID=266062 RepID=A0ABQ6Z8F9_9GAMM|nr:protein-L-isoaspartate O-methyltransferase [Pseudoxanthomonas daejeonensis]KAF1695466.1 protein-L-isoaspartate O-methyltransferase [Pseudoxanthomonas daejeonensis]
MTIDYARARELMVEQQVRPWDVLDMAVLDVVGRLPRERFVAEQYRALAYADMELPLGHGATMMKPVVEGRMLQALQLQPGDSVLEVGTGSGYISACLGALAREVVSLERVPELAAAARARLDATGLGTNVRIEVADALQYEGGRQFDAVCVTAAVAEVPARFLQWLRPGGRLFVVRGQAPVMEAVRLVKGDTVNAAATESLFETELGYLHGAEPVPQFLF